MEIVAIDMKLRGMYMARQLSFGGVTFSICEVELTDKFKEAYDASVKLVRKRDGRGTLEIFTCVNFSLWLVSVSCMIGIYASS